MVFIHGGAFIIGGSSAGVYDGGRLAATGNVVLVTLNYRLGALGFLSGIEGLTGNYGFMDQQLALRWVQENIRAFQGDPQRVTIFGESAGAMSVGLHLISPQSQGMFRAAIMESNPYGIPYKTKAEARHFAKDLRDLLGCEFSGLRCMRSAPVAAIVKHQSSRLIVLAGLLEGLSGELVWAPVIDEVVIPGQPNAASATVPLIVGTNLDEGEFFAGGFRIRMPFERKEVPRLEYEAALHLMFPSAAVKRIEKRPRYAPVEGDNTSAFARMLTDYVFTCANRHVMNDARGNVFAFQFAHTASYDVWPGVPLCAPEKALVCHGFEIPFVFGNPVDVRTATAPPNEASRFSAEDQPTAEAMTEYWTSFAATLDPNRPQAPRWPRFTKQHPFRLVFRDRVSVESGSGASCRFWDTIGYGSPGLFEKISPSNPNSRR
jgi:carboxylesterase type B